MAFLETVLPVDVSPGASGGPGFSTTIKELRGGGEYRNKLWQHPRRQYSVRYNTRSVERLEDELQAFILQTGGAFDGFRARDWSDYQVTDEPIGTGDGATWWFRLTKAYGTYVRRILKPDAASVTISVGGSPVVAGVDPVNGIAVLQATPAIGQPVTWTGDFHVPVRFENDNMTIQMMIYSKGLVPDLGLREIRLREIIDEVALQAIRDSL